MPGDRGINIFIHRIEGYSDLGGFMPGDRGINIFIHSIAGYSDLGGATPLQYASITWKSRTLLHTVFCPTLVS